MSVITTTIRMEDSQFFARLNQMEARLASLAGNFTAIATRMAASFGPIAGGVVGVTGAVLGLKKAITEAANMEQLETSFTVLIGSAQVAQETLAKLQKFADETTFQMPELAGAAKQLIAFGVGAGEVVGTLRMLGDVAAGLNIPLSELTDVYGRNLVQGRLFSRDIYQFQGRGIPIIAALAKQFNVAENEIMGMVEAGQVGSKQMVAAFQDMTKEGGIFAGMLAKQSKTFNGMMSTLADNITAVFREFGKPLMEALKPVVETLIQRVKDMVPAAQEFGQRVARVVKGLYDAFQAGTLSEVVSTALEYGFMKAMNALAAGLEKALAVAGGAFAVVLGNPQFWDGLLKTLLGIAGQFGAAILRAFEKPLAYVQAFMEKAMDGSLFNDDAELAARKRVNETRSDIVNPIMSGAAYRTKQGTATPADAEVIRLYDEAVAVALDQIRRERAGDPQFDTVGMRADRILSEGGPRFGFSGAGLNASEIAKEGAGLVKEGAELMRKPAGDFLEAAKLIAANYEPAALYDEEKLRALEARLRKAFPAIPGVGVAGDSDKARAVTGGGGIIGGSASDIIADSLAKIGGGGGVAGISAALEEAREQTAELKTQTVVLTDIKEGIRRMERFTGNGVIDITVMA